MRQAAAMHLAPLTLRVALGLIFLFYGAGKLFYEFELDLTQEARLVELGVIEARPGGPQPPLESVEGVRSFDLIMAQDGTDEPASEEPEPDAAEAPDAAPQPAGDLEPRSVSRLYGLVFAMDNAHQRGHWPDFLASGAAYRNLARLAAITEFAGGFFVIVGVFTRLWALSFLGTMIVACFLTQISPWIGKTDAFLGFLPPWPLADSAIWITAYQTLFFQLIIAAAAKALFFTGPGKLSIDGVIFGGRSKKSKKDDAYDDE